MTCIDLAATSSIEGINLLGRGVVGEHQAVAVARSCLHTGYAPKRLAHEVRPTAGDAWGAVCGTVGHCDVTR
jgi:hypothetical protein